MTARARTWLLVFGIWTILALLSASQAVVWLELENRPINWERLLSGTLVGWYSCAIFTPAFFWAARRFPIDARDWIRHVPIHLVLCAAASVLKYVVEWTTMTQLLGFEQAPLARMVTLGFISENIAFWCMAGVIHAIEFQRGAREREVLTARLQARLSEAQLNALAARLHPHFLFNTLQGISTLVHRDPMAADRMLGHLSTLLRRTLHGAARHEVTLAEELAVLEDYLAIVQIRFGDRVAVVREIDPDTLRCLVPSLVLQPLLENAFEHGIARRAGSSRVTIRATKRGGRLELTVRDDGPGPAAGTMKEGVGLGTTRGRLAQLYGPAATLTVAGHPEGGTIVTTILPDHEAPILGSAEAA